MLDLKLTFISLLIIILIDGAYLNLNKDFYKPILEPGQNLNLIYGVLAWLTIVISIQLLVLSRPDINLSNSFVYGALLGFASYALYNFTNASTYPNKWNNQIIIGDTAWGMLLTGSMSWIMFRLNSVL
jgi:uncharacterized membrane protein